MPKEKPAGTWVQTDREAHRLWSALIKKSPVAGRIMHVLTSYLGHYNSVVMAQEDLAFEADCSERRLRDAVKLLVEDRWIEVRKIGRGSTRAYIINDRVAWHGPREGLRKSIFSAMVIVSEAAQGDADLDNQEPLRRVPGMYAGERQLPDGAGDEDLRDLPASALPYDPETGEIIDISTLEIEDYSSGKINPRSSVNENSRKNYNKGASE